MKITRILSKGLLAIACLPAACTSYTPGHEEPSRSMMKATQRSIMDEQQALVDEFGQALKQRWSYYHAGAVNFNTEIQDLKNKISRAPLTDDDLQIEFQRILMLGIDGHARVSSAQYPDGSLPLLFGPVGSHLAVVKSDYSALLDADHPFLESIDGKPVSTWLELASRYIAKGSPQLVQGRGARMLSRNFRFLQKVGGFSQKDEVEVVLSSENGDKKSYPVKLQFGEHSRHIKKNPATERSLGPSRWLADGKIGYLRIARMDDAAAGEIDRWMQTFRGANGLVIDVRNNGGGSREALRRMYSYLASPHDEPHVINAARYRKFKDFDYDHLTSRFMYRENDPHWSSREKSAIAKFRLGFSPKWIPPSEEFSDWHYLVLDREQHPGIYHFDKPVVVLSNEYIFSAADIFMAGMRSLSNVTIIGTPSGGGSARVVNDTLSDGKTMVRMGSMISYQADGKLFDGVGVPVDIRVDPVPEFYLRYGLARDKALDAACKLILDRLKP